MPRPTATTDEVKEDLYLKLCDLEQKHAASRWTVTTFFLSVSFAIFGISLGAKDSVVPIAVPQAIAVAIYWFTYILFLRFHAYGKFLRSRIRRWEDEGWTTLGLQTGAAEFMAGKVGLSSGRLLLIFGILYTIAAIAISILIRP